MKKSNRRYGARKPDGRSRDKKMSKRWKRFQSKGELHEFARARTFPYPPGTLIPGRPEAGEPPFIIWNPGHPNHGRPAHPGKPESWGTPILPPMRPSRPTKPSRPGSEINQKPIQGMKPYPWNDKVRPGRPTRPPSNSKPSKPSKPRRGSSGAIGAPGAPGAPGKPGAAIKIPNPKPGDFTRITVGKNRRDRRDAIYGRPGTRFGSSPGLNTVASTSVSVGYGSKEKQIEMGDPSPGIYHGQRGVRNLPMFRHEYVLVVPKDERGLSPQARKSMRRVSRGKKGVVLGAYNRRGKLKSGLNERYDSKAARASIKKGDKNLRKVADIRSNSEINEAIRTSKSFRTKRYPHWTKNMVGIADNSNTYARSMLRKLGYDDEGLKSGRLRNPGSTRRMDLHRKGKLHEFALRPAQRMRVRRRGFRHHVGLPPHKPSPLWQTKNVEKVWSPNAVHKNQLTKKPKKPRPTKRRPKYKPSPLWQTKYVDKMWSNKEMPKPVRKRAWWEKKRNLLGAGAVGLGGAGVLAYSNRKQYED